MIQKPLQTVGKNPAVFFCRNKTIFFFHSYFDICFKSLISRKEGKVDRNINKNIYKNIDI